jgi:hypothetical protein
VLENSLTAQSTSFRDDAQFTPAWCTPEALMKHSFSPSQSANTDNAQHGCVLKARKNIAFLLGRLMVQEQGQEVRLTTRHYPWWAALWCYGIMFGIIYITIQYTRMPTLLKICATCFSLTIASLPVAIEFKACRFPPLIIFDHEHQTIKLPRINPNAALPAEGASLALQAVELLDSDGLAVYTALYLVLGGTREELVFLNQHKSSAPHRFAQVCGLPMTTLSAISLQK